MVMGQEENTQNVSSLSPPELIFNDTNSENGRELPNVFHLLQCFTLKNASDAFDLERYLNLT